MALDGSNLRKITTLDDLSGEERAVLDFEAEWVLAVNRGEKSALSREKKERAIARMGMSLPHYYLILRWLLTQKPVIEKYPDVLVNYRARIDGRKEHV